MRLFFARRACVETCTQPSTQVSVDRGALSAVELDNSEVRRGKPARTHSHDLWAAPRPFAQSL